jgi:poly(A) polymerase
MPLATMEDTRPVVKPDASRLLTRISRYLTREGINSYLVGGFVRDMLLGRATIDIDIAVGAGALEVAAAVAGALDGKYIALDEENGVGRVVLPGKKWQIDFTSIRGDITQDLARRDFSIDAMALELGKVSQIEKLIDPFHGRDDLRRGVIKAVAGGIFKADPVRLLRAVRLAGELSFTIDSNTESLIRRDGALIASVPGERVREELLRLMALPGATARLAYLDRLGLLTALIPELALSRGVDQPRMHVWDVFQHSVQTVGAVEFLLREGDWEHAGPDILDVVPWSERLKGHFDGEISHGSTRRSLLKLAALLHDIAKPQTKAVAADGRTRFLGHPEEGAAAAASIMERLRFSNRETQYVTLLVKYHLRPTQMANEGTPTPRAVYRFFRDTGESGIDILFLSLADHLAARGPALDNAQWREHARVTDYVLKKHFEEAGFARPPRLLDGHDIMKTYGLPPGPQIGRLLEAVREAQAAGEIADRHEALAYVKRSLEGAGNSAKNRLKE